MMGVEMGKREMILVGLEGRGIWRLGEGMMIRGFLETPVWTQN